MTRTRVVVVCALFWMFVIGHLIPIVRGEEYWPFSRYPMYSKPRKAAHITTYELRGVNAKGEEFNLRPRAFGLASTYFQRIITQLKQSRRKPKQANKLGRALIEWYERERDAERLRGPRLRAVRLYANTWKTLEQADDGAPSAATRPSKTPNVRRILEIRASGVAAATRPTTQDAPNVAPPATRRAVKAPGGKAPAGKETKP